MTKLAMALALGAALTGGTAVSASAQEFLTQDDIASLVASMQGGNSGGSVSVGGGGGTVSSGDVTGGGSSQIGGDEGTAIADASGGDFNLSELSR